MRGGLGGGVSQHSSSEWWPPLSELLSSWGTENTGESKRGKINIKKIHIHKHKKPSLLKCEFLGQCWKAWHSTCALFSYTAPYQERKSHLTEEGYFLSSPLTSSLSSAVNHDFNIGHLGYTEKKKKERPKRSHFSSHLPEGLKKRRLSVVSFKIKGSTRVVRVCL